MALAIAIAIGLFRALSLGDPRCIVWLDVNSTVPKMLAANATAELFKWILEKVCARMCWIRFPMAVGFAQDNPLGDDSLRETPLWGGDSSHVYIGSYAYIFGVGGLFIYFAFAAYVGPRFVFGLDECAYIVHDSEMLAWPMVCGRLTNGSGIVAGM
jgi:hypothetical protein